jgi:hypothetical protein
MNRRKIFQQSNSTKVVTTVDSILGKCDGKKDSLSLDLWRPADVRFGSQADIEAYSPDVCFTPESRHGFSEPLEVEQFL